MMKNIHISANRHTINGLDAMMRAMDHAAPAVSSSVDLPSALYIVAVAKHAPDLDLYFPYGKWATIQAIEARIEKALSTLSKMMSISLEDNHV